MFDKAQHRLVFRAAQLLEDVVALLETKVLNGLTNFLFFRRRGRSEVTR